MLAKLKKRKRLRKHGFLKRSATASGRNILKRRRQKGRYKLTVSYDNRYKKTNGKSRHHIIAGGTARVVRYTGSNMKFRPRNPNKTTKKTDS